MEKRAKTRTKSDLFLNFDIDKLKNALYNTLAFGENAAIAQSVERILGKDEVASSNLASSSISQLQWNWRPHPFA